MLRLLLSLVLIGVCSTAMALDRRVELVNDSSQVIYEFYASNVDRDSWEEDILGDTMLYPGESIVINIDDRSGYCMFDFKTVMQSGQVIVDNQINVCEIYDYTIY